MKQVLDEDGLDQRKVRAFSNLIAICDFSKDNKTFKFKPEAIISKQNRNPQQLGDEYIFKIVSTIQQIWKALNDDEDHFLQRLIYDAFGVSWLDGLDLFDNFSSNYCLISKKLLAEKPGMTSALNKIQNHLLSVHKNKKLLELWETHKKEWNVYKLSGYTTEYYKNALDLSGPGPQRNGR